MKLYYSPGTCSLAAHIALKELGISFDLVKVDLATKASSEGLFTKVNPKGYVPALALDNGEVLTEVGVIMQYLADLKPEKELVPKLGTMERYRLMEWLNYISTEVHKAFSPLFGTERLLANKEGIEQLKSTQRARLQDRFSYISKRLENSAYLAGPTFSIADIYLFTVLRWSNYVGADMTNWKKLMGYVETIRSRPMVSEAMRTEGLK